MNVRTGIDVHLIQARRNNPLVRSDHGWMERNNGTHMQRSFSPAALEIPSLKRGCLTISRTNNIMIGTVLTKSDHMDSFGYMDMYVKTCKHH